MARIVLIVLMCVAVYWIVRRAAAPAGPPRAPHTPGSGTGVPMLQCAYCGIHFPEQEVARGSDGRIFCSADHERRAFHAGSA